MRQLQITRNLFYFFFFDPLFLVPAPCLGYTPFGCRVLSRDAEKLNCSLRLNQKPALHRLCLGKGGIGGKGVGVVERAGRHCLASASSGRRMA